MMAIIWLFEYNETQWFLKKWMRSLIICVIEFDSGRPYGHYLFWMAISFIQLDLLGVPRPLHYMILLSLWSWPCFAQMRFISNYLILRFFKILDFMSSSTLHVSLLVGVAVYFIDVACQITEMFLFVAIFIWSNVWGCTPGPERDMADSHSIWDCLWAVSGVCLFEINRVYGINLVFRHNFYTCTSNVCLILKMPLYVIWDA